MPGSQLRRVHQLHLHSSEESLNRRGAILIEDALHTATLPDAGGSRLLLVRALSLGRFRANVAPASLALLIEQRLHECASRAIPADDPVASLASAVYFRDETEPYVRLAARVARGESTDAWFWPLSVRGWGHGMACEDALRALLAGLSQTEAAWAGVLSLVRVLFREAAVTPFLGSLCRADGPALLALFGWRSPSAEPARPMPQPERKLVGLPAAWTSIARSWFENWGADDSRSLWLAAVLSMLAAEECGPALSTPSPWAVQEALALIRALQTTDFASAQTFAYAGSPNADSRIDNEREPAPSGSEAQTPQGKTSSSLKVGRCTEAVPAFLAGEKHVRSDRPGSTADATQSQQKQPDDARLGDRLEQANFPVTGKPAIYTDRTSFGGLFFLISAMQRAGLPLWLEEHPELAQWNLPALLLRAIAHRLRVADEDPVIEALHCRLDGVPTEVIKEMPPWIRILRRWCRRVARIGLHSLIHRAGRITSTETHIDVAFLAAEADIRVRKAGLDVDPGWVPWFGRVVRFHYLTGAEFNG